MTARPIRWINQPIREYGLVANQQSSIRRTRNGEGSPVPDPPQNCPAPSPPCETPAAQATIQAAETLRPAPAATCHSAPQHCQNRQRSECCCRLCRLRHCPDVLMSRRKAPVTSVLLPPSNCGQFAFAPSLSSIRKDTAVSGQMIWVSGVPSGAARADISSS